MSRSIARSFLVLLAVGALSCAESDSETTRTLEQAARGGVAKVTLCHHPDGPSPQTITVGEPAVAAHLAHGDYLGECGACRDECEAIGLRVLEFCYGGGPAIGTEFCELAYEVVVEVCEDACPAPPPEECHAFCATMAGEAHTACLGLSDDPFLCDVGANEVFDACRDIFDCPPPPPPCDLACIETAQGMLDACLAAPPDDRICAHRADSEIYTCLAPAQALVNECLFGADGCFPAGGDCFSDCQAVPGQVYLDCIDEPVCGDIPDCAAEADAAGQSCFEGCCVDDCVRFECEPACGGDEACVDQCAADYCGPRCAPPPCDFVCPDGACVPDPAFCAPPCEGECFARFELCLGSGADPADCELALNDCLNGCVPSCPGFTCPDGRCVPDPAACEPPPCDFVCADGSCVPDPAICDTIECEHACFREFEDCLATGAPPELCEAAGEECLRGCYPVP